MWTETSSAKTSNLFASSINGSQLKLLAARARGARAMPSNSAASVGRARSPDGINSRRGSVPNGALVGGWLFTEMSSCSPSSSGCFSSSDANGLRPENHVLALHEQVCCGRCHGRSDGHVKVPSHSAAQMLFFVELSCVYYVYK